MSHIINHTSHFLESFSFEARPRCISTIHSASQTSAVNADSRFATIINWLIGRYIVVYEQCRNDHAPYGSKLLSNLVSCLNIYVSAYSTTPFRQPKLSENAVYGIGKIIKWKDLTGGIIKSESDLLISILTYMLAKANFRQESSVNITQYNIATGIFRMQGMCYRQNCEN